MSRTNTKLLLIGLLMVVALAFSTSQANACVSCQSSYPYYCSANYYTYGTPYCVPGCSYCSYTPSCVSCCDPCTTYTLGVRPGPVRRWAFGPYRWYRNYNCCYSPCYGYGYALGCYSCGTYTTGDCCQPTGTETNTAYPENTPTPAAPNPGQGGESNTMTAPTSMYPTYEESGLLTIWVPADATVIINGYKTTTKGSKRRYVSTGLEPGLTYKYEITAQLPRDGKLAEETKTVYLTAGSTKGVAFGFNRKPIDVAATPGPGMMPPDPGMMNFGQ